MNVLIKPISIPSKQAFHASRTKTTFDAVILKKTRTVKTTNTENSSRFFCCGSPICIFNEDNIKFKNRLIITEIRPYIISFHGTTILNLFKITQMIISIIVSINEYPPAIYNMSVLITRPSTKSSPLI